MSSPSRGGCAHWSAQRSAHSSRVPVVLLVRHPSHPLSDCLPHRPPPSCVIRVMLSLIASLIARRLPPSSGGSSARPSCYASSLASTRGRHAPPYRALDTTPLRRLWVRERSIRHVATVNYRPQMRRRPRQRANAMVSARRGVRTRAAWRRIERHGQSPDDQG